MNKQLKTAALAALVMVGPLSVAGTASAQTRRDVREARQDVREERRGLRDARQDLREERRDRRQAQRWNQRQRNGYYVNGDDRGEILLVGIATGVISSILLNN